MRYLILSYMFCQCHSVRSPNVVGGGSQYYSNNYDIRSFGFAALSGAFSTGNEGQRQYNPQNINDPTHANGLDSWIFSANNSNAIYGNSAKVQPKSYQLLIIIKN